MSASDKKDPKMATFSACGHTCNAARPLESHTQYVDFDKESNTFLNPSMCLDCTITHLKNRQQLTMETWATKYQQELDEIVERAMQTANEKDRNEILTTGKRAISDNVQTQSDAECLSLWHDFVNVWSGAERTRRPNKSTDYTTHVLTVSIKRDASGINANLIWKDKRSQKVVEQREVSNNGISMIQVLGAKGL